MKSKNFFGKEENNNVDMLYREIAKMVDNMSVFTPIELHDKMGKNYSAKLTIDENKVSKREKFDLLNGIKDIKSNMSNDLRKHINFYLSSNNLPEAKSELMVTDELKFNVRASYAVESLPREVNLKLREKYPFLKDDSNTFTYKYDTNTMDLNAANFKTFFEKVMNNEMPQYYRSEPAK